MEWTPHTVRADQLEASRLLQQCRISRDGDDLLPEPIWVRPGGEEGSWKVLWSPTTVPAGDAERTVLVIRNLTQDDWRMTIRLWKRYRAISPLEKALVVRALHDRGLGDERALADQLAGELDLPRSPVWMRTYRRITHWPESLRKRIHEGDLSPRLARYIEEIPEPLRQTFLQSMEHGNVMMSVQESRQLAEAARRLPKGWYPNWQNILENLSGGDNPRENGTVFLRRVREAAFPETSERRDQFEQDLESLELDGRIRVNPPDQFEGDYLEFQFRCRRDQDLSDLAEEVKRCRKLFEHV